MPEGEDEQSCRTLLCARRALGVGDRLRAGRDPQLAESCNRHLGLPIEARPTHEGQFETIHLDDHELIYRRHRRAREETGKFEPEYRLLQPGRRRSDPLLRTRFA